MPSGSATLQNANTAIQTVSRRSQTSIPPEAYATFVRESRKCTQLAFDESGKTFGSLISRTIKPSPGYLTGLWVVIQATGGVNGTTTVAAATDAPWSAIQNFSLRDAFGSVVYQSDGFGMYLIHLYSAQVGAVGLQNPTSDSWYVAMSTGTTGTGNFSYALFVPLEFDSDTGYCSLPSMNAAAQMNVSIQLAASGSVYGTAPGTVPTMQVSVYQEYWAVPIADPSLTPPDDGSSHQWTQSQGQVGLTSASNSRIQLPDVGTYLSTIILCMRDTTGARIDTPYSSDLEFWVDGVPVRIEASKVLFSRMYRQFGISRPTGVAVYSFRDSVGKVISDDNMELLLPTTPGTLVEIFSGLWGTFSNGPATVQTYTGKLYPVGPVPDHAGI